MQSSFHKTLLDSPIEGKEYFTEELFPEESRLLKGFMSETQRLTDKEDPLSQLDFDAPVSTVFYPPEIDGVCDPRSEQSSFVRGVTLEGADLNRPMVPDATSPQECCAACLRVNNCLAWTYDAEEGLGCSLKGSTGFNQKLNGRLSVTSGALARGEKLKRGRVSLPKVRVYHGTTCIHRNESVLTREPETIAIGRYMLERSHMQAGYGLDEYSVSACAGLMDEVWVPTEWHKGVFDKLMKQQGVYGQEIAVIPEAVDTTLFDPALATDGGKAFRRDNVKLQFLSIFKWEHRKGWDVLLDSYWRAFTKEDDVLLRLRTYIPASTRKMFGDNVTFHIESFAATRFNKQLHELAPVVWERGPASTGGTDTAMDRALTRVEMRDLLASSDVFVLPTRGEGWGLPIAEAMSMALPTIVTNATGPTAYANDDNAYLIDASGPSDELGYAQPKAESLISLFAQVQEDLLSGKAAMKGKEARKTMQRLSPESVVGMMVKRVRDHAWRRGWVTV